MREFGVVSLLEYLYFVFLIWVTRVLCCHPKRTDLTERQPSNTSRLDSRPHPSASQSSSLTRDKDRCTINPSRGKGMEMARETWRITPLDLWECAKVRTLCVRDVHMLL